MSYFRPCVGPSLLLAFPSTGIEPRGTVVARGSFVTCSGLEPGISHRVHEQVHLASNHTSR